MAPPPVPRDDRFWRHMLSWRTNRGTYLTYGLAVVALIVLGASPGSWVMFGVVAVVLPVAQVWLYERAARRQAPPELAFRPPTLPAVMPPRVRRRRFWHGFATIWSWLWGSLTVVVLFVAIPEWVGIEPVAAEDVQGGIIVATICVFMAGVGLLMLRLLDDAGEPVTLVFRPSTPPRIQLARRPLLPRPGSAARTPVRRLDEAETALAELLRRLQDVPGAAADDAVEHTWQVATDFAASLRSVAARVEAVELAAEHSPSDKRATLEEAAGSLLAHLDQGLDAYRGLIAAAGMLAASTAAMASDELAEATERLAGLAGALRELSQDGDYRS